MNTITRNMPIQVPVKISLSLLVVAVPFLRVFFGKRALACLYTRVLVSPRDLAFVLLSRLGTNNDPVFVWYVLDLLLRVPDEVFGDEWVSKATLPVDNIPGPTVHDRVSLAQQVVMKTFGLWALAGKAAAVSLDLEPRSPKLNNQN